MQSRGLHQQKCNLLNLGISHDASTSCTQSSMIPTPSATTFLNNVHCESIHAYGIGDAGVLLPMFVISNEKARSLADSHSTTPCTLMDAVRCGHLRAQLRIHAGTLLICSLHTCKAKADARMMNRMSQDSSWTA